MKLITQIAPVQKTDVEIIYALFMKQNIRQYALDTRLRHFTSQEVINNLEKLESDQRDIVKVTDERGAVHASALPTIIEYSDASSMLALFPKHCGMANLMILPTPNAPHAAEITTTLLQSIEAYWQSKGATGAMISWPTLDPWIEPILHQHDFLTYSTMALRDANDLPDYGQAPHQNVIIRQAQREDEDALVKLIVDEMTFHENLTPFDRVVPGTEIGARERLAQVWLGVSPHEGASLFLVAEIDGQLVGMMECLLSDLRDVWSLLTAEYYGYISIAMIAATHRGQGIGHHLLDATLRELKSYGVRKFSLYYVPANPLSSRFWQSKGFRPVLMTYQKRY